MGAAADRLAPAPVMQTCKDAAGVKILEETFVITPKPGQPQGAADKADGSWS